MPASTTNRFLLLYGSETGQAQAIAEEINEAAHNHGLAPELHCISSTDKKFNIEKESCLVVVVSTTGEGDPPETAAKFWRRLKKKTLPSDHLAHLSYALLALGDSNYTNFCQNGKNFDKRLEALGAKRFYDTGHADDAVGLEVAVEPWIAALWPALRNQLGLDSSRNGNTNTCEVDGGRVWPTSATPSSLKDGTGSASKQNFGEHPVTRIDGQMASVVVGRNGAPDPSPLPEEDKLGVLKEETLPPADKGSSRTPKAVISLSQGGGELSSESKPLNYPRYDDGETATNSSDAGREDAREESLVLSLPPLCNASLTLPLNPPSFLEITYVGDASQSIVRELPIQNGCVFPSAASTVTMATVSKARRLTRSDAVKVALELELQLPKERADVYQPGDSFGVVCRNDSDEVSKLLARLGVVDEADSPFTLKLEAGTRKRRATVPEFVPVPATLRLALTQCFDIRTPPKRAFVRMLSEHTEDPGQKRRLQELCSKEGATDYNRFVRRDHLSLSDVLEAFPSCLPPVERVMEHFTRLLPRPYSIASSPLPNGSRLRFAFNILLFSGTRRKPAQEGLCSGWLNQITSSFQEDRGSDSEPSGTNTRKLNPEDMPKIPVYFRTSTRFRLPADVSKPVVMIGPGTGVAPFIGFMEHRQLTKEKCAAGETFGSMWLFYGCRHRDRDFLYREKIDSFVQSGILSKLSVSSSRDGDQGGSTCRYVQDRMRLHKESLADLVLRQEAVIFVCGDANGMAKSVMEVWTEILCESTGKSLFEVNVLLATLREEQRYLQDVWT